MASRQWNAGDFLRQPRRADVEDPWQADASCWGQQGLQPHQRAAIDAAARLLEHLRQAGAGGGWKWGGGGGGGVWAPPGGGAGGGGVAGGRRRRRSGAGALPARLHGGGQLCQRLQRIVPTQAGIGDALAVFERAGLVLAGRELLGACVQMAFDHQAEDAARAGGQLRRDIAGHVELLFVLLATVGMAAIDHQQRGQLGRLQVLAGGGDAGGVVVGRFAAAQDDVAILVALGVDDGDLAIFVHRQEVMAPAGRLYGVGGDADVAVGAVLEAYRRRNARGQLAVHLAFGGAGTD